MGAAFSQFFPPAPTLTEANLPSQAGKVFIVTGGASGVGLELCRILYQAGGRVYMAGRSELNAQSAISQIQSEPCSTPGSLVFLAVSLDDLSSIKPAATRFTTAESRLDVLFNNAGVSNPPRHILSPQGHEMQMATNCLGPYLLTQLLLPTLLRTAASSPSPASVRVVWTSSIVVDYAPTPNITPSDLANPPPDQQRNYTTSKLGNWLLASELSRRVADQGVLSLTQNPGNLKTPLLRHLPRWVAWLSAPLLYHPKMGAYTELYAGLSPDLGMEDGGGYVVPWGRRHPGPRDDLLAALRAEGDMGGTGQASMFVEFCEKQTERFR